MGNLLYPFRVHGNTICFVLALTKKLTLRTRYQALTISFPRSCLVTSYPEAPASSRNQRFRIPTRTSNGETISARRRHDLR